MYAIRYCIIIIAQFNLLTNQCSVCKVITRIDTLNLPNLRELFLHRNNISQIASLSSCPRLQRLWLFQNQLTSLQFLSGDRNIGHAVFIIFNSISIPTGCVELEELWVQANQITSLSALMNCVNLTNLNFSANPINDLNEVKYLANCSKLNQLAFNDIHFGKCDLVDEEGYRNYIILLLRQVSFHLPRIAFIPRDREGCVLVAKFRWHRH